MHPAFALLILAQAPPAAGLWRVAHQTLARPAAIADGALAFFWNPALVGPVDGSDPRLTASLEAIHGAEATGVSGVLTGVRIRTSRRSHLGLIAGRIGVEDLVRTSSSPAPEPGEVRFHAAAYGVAGSVAPVPGVHLGLLALAHRAALDLTTETAWTLDGGVWVRAAPRLALAVSTHFLSRELRSDYQQDVFGAAEWEAWRGALRGLPSALAIRAGIAGAHGGGLDGTLGLGLTAGGHVGIDLLVSRERHYGSTALRGALALSIATGHYRAAFARDNGINDLGAAFRFGLQATVP